MSDLTSETIRAVFEHHNARVAEIDAAMKACRPNCYSFSWAHLAADGLFRAKAAFDPKILSDGMKPWYTMPENADFDAVCDQVLADIAAYRADMFGSDVERMALAIIQIKHRDGAVTDRALRLSDFSQAAIEQIHERATLLANEMSDGKPFEVKFVGAGNHAEVA